VIVKDHTILSAGFHLGPGHFHAERSALSSDIDFSNATAYITLEPCCHFGRTPPCTDILIEKKIKRVVYAYGDPNPLVQNKSAAILRAHNIACEHFALPEIDDFYQPYSYWWQHKKPYLSAKIALSLDGKVGYLQQSVQLTGETARLFTHQQRLEHDAILTGINTILIDDPALNVRLAQTIKKTVIILDSALRLPPYAQILQTAEKIILFHSKQLKIIPSHLQEAHIECIAVPQREDHLDLVHIINILGERGMHAVWIEAGSQIFNSFLRLNLLQQCYIYIAPCILGERGQSGITHELDLSHAALSCAQMDKDIRWQIIF
jgi:diaminohydroxyphosphoribosylaminopyrimidine deaminase/5-amino-6-(5-phosphoribosylamino)uracil reductase